MGKKKFFLTFALLFSIKFLFAQTTEVTTISIKNARQTSYKKAEDTGNDTIVLEGSVELSVQKNDTTSEIKADRITYDRKTEMLYAVGNVEIVTKGSGSGGETTTASSLLLNTSTLEGVFDGGRVVQTQSDALNLPSGSTLIVFSDLFGKGSENTISFKNSSLTFCNDENPHWHIDATRTWLLPGGEFAFFNALLYVGEIPVLYLPAFYYPKDELIFNPVFSYRKREGYSIQTTTYVYGRKPLSSGSSTSSSSSSTDTETSTSAEALKGLYNFVKPSSLKEQKREGLVLHNLDADYQGNTSDYVKIMADTYTNLGYMVGIDSVFQPSKTYVTKLALAADIGVSKTLFKNVENGLYYPFSDTGKQYQDESTFLGVTMPFRYSGKVEMTVSKPIRINLSMPIYSDPFYNYDFKTYRVETMDWISYLLDNMGKDDDKEVSITEVTSFIWRLNGSGSPTLPDSIKPYINYLSINWDSSITFSSKSTNTSEMTYKGTKNYETLWITNTPTRKFFYPSLITPLKTTVSVSGTLFSWPIEQKKYTSVSTSAYPVTLNKPDELKSDRTLKEEAEKAEEEARKKEMEEKGIVEEPAENTDEENKEDLFEYYLPELEYSPSQKTVSSGFAYNLSYKIDANIENQLSYNPDKLKVSEDFKWDNVSSYMYLIKTPASVTSKMSYGGNFIEISNGLAYSPVWQDHPYISEEEYTENQIKNLQLSDYRTGKQDISNNNTVSFKPFTYMNIISDSSISWNTNIKLYRKEFIGTVDEPEWDVLTVDFDDEKCVTTNSLTEVLSAKELDNKLVQTLTLSQVLPPLLKQFNGTFALTFPYVTGSIGTGIQETTKDTNVPESERWKKSPLNQSTTVTIPVFKKNLSVSENYTYNLEDENPESLKLSSSWNGMSLAYVMSYTYGYDLDKDWKVRSEKEFLPYSLSLSYSAPAKTFYRWFNRISVAPSLSTSVTADLIRPTNSYFLFTPALTFRFNEFLDIKFSSSSRNSIIYWYFHNEQGDLYSEGGSFPANMINDLMDSFRFDDRTKRENSGFKLKSLNMTVSHDLHDWKFNMTLKIEPRILTENGRKTYDFTPYMTIGVVWNPMESFKTKIIDDYGEWKME